MTTRGTRKFEYTDGLADKSGNVATQPGTLGVPSSGVGKGIVITMFTLLAAVALASALGS